VRITSFLWYALVDSTRTGAAETRCESDSRARSSTPRWKAGIVDGIEGFGTLGEASEEEGHSLPGDGPLCSYPSGKAGPDQSAQPEPEIGTVVSLAAS
jgi:hypothetical protein